MTKSVTIVLALAAGLAGGMLSRFVAPPAAHAQQQQPPAKEVRAQSFVLVDSADNIVGTFTYEQRQYHAFTGPFGSQIVPAGPARIVLKDAGGREIWSAGGASVRPASER